MSLEYVTNNVKSFIERNTGPIIIFDAGNSAYWTGQFLDACNIDYFGYIDDSVIIEGEMYGRRPVYHQDKLKLFVGKQVRFIVTSVEYSKKLSVIERLCELYNIAALALIPLAGYVEYNINYMLGYFRQRLIRGNVPTFISNDAVGVRFYQFLGLKPISPTLSTSFSYEDFIKLCENPMKYFQEDMKESMLYTRNFGTNMIHDGFTVREVGDIKVVNIGTDTWNSTRHYVNPNRFVYLMTDKYGGIPFDIMKRWRQLPGKKLLLSIRDMNIYPYGMQETIIQWKRVFDLKMPIENYFDLVGFINR